MAALSQKGVKQILDALRDLGGETTLAQLAAKLDRDVNGLSQTLSNNRKLNGLIAQGNGKGGARIVRLTESGKSYGPLFPSRAGEQLSLLKPK